MHLHQRGSSAAAVYIRKFGSFRYFRIRKVRSCFKNNFRGKIPIFPAVFELITSIFSLAHPECFLDCPLDMSNPYVVGCVQKTRIKLPSLAEVLSSLRLCYFCFLLATIAVTSLEVPRRDLQSCSYISGSFYEPECHCELFHEARLFVL